MSKIEYRRLTAEELTFLHKTNIRISRLINDFDDRLKHTDIYRQDFKKVGNRFIEISEAIARKFWTVDVSEEEIRGSMDDFTNMLDFAENQEMVAAGLEYVSPQRVEMFYRDMEKLFKKHGMPLRMKDGVVIYDEMISKRTLSEDTDESKAAA